MLKRDDPIIQRIIKIASGFGIFDCMPCAISIKAFLVKQGIHGKQIQIDTGSQDPIYGRIYDDSIDELIATTGHHQGIAVMIEESEIMFDNIHPQGIQRSVWMQNFYSPILENGQNFIITEILF